MIKLTFYPYKFKINVNACVDDQSYSLRCYLQPWKLGSGGAEKWSVRGSGFEGGTGPRCCGYDHIFVEFIIAKGVALIDATGLQLKMSTAKTAAAFMILEKVLLHIFCSIKNLGHTFVQCGVSCVFYTTIWAFNTTIGEFFFWNKHLFFFFRNKHKHKKGKKKI